MDGLYLKLLNRPSDSGGRTSFVNVLQHGGTVEQVISAMVASPEYSTLTGGTDAGFVQSLYSKLLGRVASPGEVAGWVSVVPSLGRSGVANAFLRSGEFRFDVVLRDEIFN